VSDVLTADGLKRKCGDELITRAYNDPELASRSAIDRDTDLPTEIVLVDLTGSPVRVRSRLPIGNGFADELSERVLRNLEGTFPHPWPDYSANAFPRCAGAPVL
jgi:hypothetical protein